MSDKWLRFVRWFFLAIALSAILYFALPFGLPKLPGGNCGPEHWAWLGVHFESKQDVITYLQERELQYLSGSSLPRLTEFPPGTSVTRLDVEIDWQALEQEIKVENRLFYKIYSVSFHHPACYPTGIYTLRVTSFGWASLYGCCGI